MNKASLVGLCVASLMGALIPVTAEAGEAAAPARPSSIAPRVPGEVIVRFDHDAAPSSRASARVAVGAEDHARLGVPGLEVLELDGTSVSDAVSELEARPGVLYAEPNYVVTASGMANDGYFPYQWGLHDSSGEADIDAPAAWQRATGDDNVTVAIVDTGVAWDHPDLAGNIWTNPGESGAKASNGIDDDGNGFVDDVRGWDWVDDDNDPMDVTGHGTHVAGTVGARTNNDIGVAGVGWNMRLMPLRVLSAGGSGSTADSARAFHYAAQAGAQVVNASFGGGGYSRAVADAVAAHPDVLYVAAAGNESANNEVTPSWPCNLALENVLCVTALERSNTLASYANTGATTVDLAAPGSGIISTVPHRATVFTEDFESDVSGRWESEGTSSWGPEAGPWGTAYADSPGGFYRDGTDSWLMTNKPVNVSEANGCSVSYKLKMDLQQYDVIEIHASDGGPWRNVAAYSGSTWGWVSVTEDLGSLGNWLYLRFRIRTDGSSTNDGVAIDDISVRCSMRTYAPDDYRFFSGTSMATPHVAGAAGVLFSASSGSSLAQVRAALMNGTQAVPSTAGLTVSGGRLNLAKSLDLLGGSEAEQPVDEPVTLPVPEPEPEPVVSPEPTPSPENDAPQPDPVTSPTPTPSPVASPETVEHDRAVILRLVRGPRLKGRVRAIDSYTPCVEKARVVLRRNGRYLRSVTTDASGAFLVKVPSYRGRYTARVAPSLPGDGHVCNEARSSSVR